VDLRSDTESVPAATTGPRPRRRRVASALVLSAVVASFVLPVTLTAAFAELAQPTTDAQADLETDPVDHPADAADDPVIWVNEADPSKFAVIGTDRAGALEVFDEKGTRIQHIPDGTPNNVDLRKDFLLGGTRIVLVGAADGNGSGGAGELRFYRLDPATRQLTNVTKNGHITLGVRSYGFCMYHSPVSGRFYAFGEDKGDGRVEQVELFDDGGLVNGITVRHLAVGGMTEGCVADDGLARFYISEESTGVWKYGAEPGDSVTDRYLVDATGKGGGNITTPEGLTIVYQPNGTGYLIASSQAVDTYNVYRREGNNEPVRHFHVIDGPTADGCTHTDGIDAVAANLGPSFPQGLFVCQDDQNTLPGTVGHDTFKYVRLEKIVALAPASGGPGPQEPGTNPGTNPGTGGTGTAATGYWMVGTKGNVYGFGEARAMGDAPVGSHNAVDLEPTPARDGYWVVDDVGSVYAFGGAGHLGSVDATGLAAGEKVTSLSATRSGAGYWIFTTRGRVIPFGDAPFLGDMSRTTLNGPVLDSIPTPSGNGYYMVGSDGGIFSFGDAVFFGSMGGKPLNKPVQSLVPDADANGYWLVASDGGIFAFDANFRGSMGGSRLNRPVTGMVRFGDGYLMVGEDGGIFNFSDQPFLGSLGASPPPNPIASVASF
jgi:3-phytase